MKRRVLSVMLAAALCLGLLPGRAEAAEETVEVQIEGTAITGGYYKITESGPLEAGTADDFNICFVPETNTLTLKDAALTKGQTAVKFIYPSNDTAAVLELIGENQIEADNYAIHADRNGSIPSSSADVNVHLTITGSGTLTTQSIWGIQATNLTIENTTLDMTTGGHSALNITRDLTIREAEITTADNGDGGDFYVCRSLRISDSKIDMRNIQVEYPSIYLSNTYCPDALKITPAVVIESSTLQIGGLSTSSLGYMLYVAYCGAEIIDSTLASANNSRTGIASAQSGPLLIRGNSHIDSGTKLAIKGTGKTSIEANAAITGRAEGAPLVNNGLILLPGGVSAEELNDTLCYYGGGTVKTGTDTTYHSVRFDLRDGTPLDEIKPQWILDNSPVSAPDEPEKDGYSFSGWQTDREDAWVFDSSAVTESIVFSPKWTANSYADYTAVDTALAKVPADLTKYTSESAAALQAAVSAVVRGLYASEQARVDGFARTIEAALAGLAGKPADYTAVDAALAQIPADLTKYTSESAAALQAAAGAVVRDLTALEQEQVDNFARAIEAALAGLVEKPDTPDRPAPPDSPGEPSRPSGSSGSTAKPSLPVYTDTGIQDGKSAPETTAVPPAVVRGTTATAKVDAATGREIIKQAVEHGSERVIIAPDIAGEVTETEVSLPASTISELHSRTGASLTISTPAARVTIPNEGLGCLASGSGNVTAAAKRSGSILSLSITAEGSPVTDIPGGITLIVPVEYAFPGTVAALVRPDGTREIIRKSIAADGSVIIPLRGSAVVEIMDNSKRFADVPAESWAADAAAFASARELFGGTGPDTFSPGAPMTRGMLAAVLHNLEGNPVQAASIRFSDVEDGAWYAAGIRWAAACGIVDGYSGGLFGPGDTITREQLAVMLWRYAGRPAPTRLRLDFPDADQVSGWALDALCWAEELGILNGRGSLLAPSGFATRAEAAQMLKNFLERT